MSWLHLYLSVSFAIDEGTERSHSPNPAVTLGSGIENLTRQASEVRIHQDEPTTQIRSNHYLRTLSHQAIRTCSDLLTGPELRRWWVELCKCLVKSSSCLVLTLLQPKAHTITSTTDLKSIDSLIWSFSSVDTRNRSPSLAFTAIQLFSCCTRELAAEPYLWGCLGLSFNPAIPSYNIVTDHCYHPIILLMIIVMAIA